MRDCAMQRAAHCKAGAEIGGARHDQSLMASHWNCRPAAGSLPGKKLMLTS